MTAQGTRALLQPEPAQKDCLGEEKQQQNLNNIKVGFSTSILVWDDLFHHTSTSYL